LPERLPVTNLPIPILSAEANRLGYELWKRVIIASLGVLRITALSLAITGVAEFQNDERRRSKALRRF
jgi:hypothetical protein